MRSKLVREVFLDLKRWEMNRSSTSWSFSEPQKSTQRPADRTASRVTMATRTGEDGGGGGRGRLYSCTVRLELKPPFQYLIDLLRKDSPLAARGFLLERK